MVYPLKLKCKTWTYMNVIREKHHHAVFLNWHIPSLPKRFKPTIFLFKKAEFLSVTKVHSSSCWQQWNLKGTASCDDLTLRWSFILTSSKCLFKVSLDQWVKTTNQTTSTRVSLQWADNGELNRPHRVSDRFYFNKQQEKQTLASVSLTLTVNLEVK